MAVETRAQAIARLKTELPTLSDYVNGEQVALSPTSYNQRIGEWADAQIRQQQASDVEATGQTLRQQVRTGLDALIADETILKGTPSPAQVRDAALRNNQALQKIVRVLINANIIEPS